MNKSKLLDKNFITPFNKYPPYFQNPSPRKTVGYIIANNSTIKTINLNSKANTIILDNNVKGYNKYVTTINGKGNNDIILIPSSSNKIKLLVKRQNGNIKISFNEIKYLYNNANHCRKTIVCLKRTYILKNINYNNIKFIKQ